MMDNQVQQFSLLMQLFMGHIMSCLHLLKEIIFFFSCVSSTLFFKGWFVCSLFSPPPKFSPKLFFLTLVLCFLFLQGEKSFFNLCCSQGELLLFIGGVVSILYRVDLFCVPLILYFLLSFIAYVYSLLSCLCQYVTKRGRSR